MPDSTDPTEPLRRQLVATINAVPGLREDLEAVYGQVWSTQQLTDEFDVRSFLAPFVLVTRKSDRVKGTLLFQHGPPRLYFSFEPTEK